MWSFRNHSNMQIAAQETFQIIIMWNGWYFCGLHFIFQDSFKNKKQRLFKIEIFCNIIMSLLSLLINIMCPCHNVSFLKNKINKYMIWIVVYPKALYRYSKSSFSQLVDSKKPQFMPNFLCWGHLFFFVCMCLFNIQNQALSVSVT